MSDQSPEDEELDDYYGGPKSNWIYGTEPEGPPTAPQIDEDSKFYNAFDEFPVCKYCYKSGGLIDRHVCDCREIMSCICFECLRQTILKRSPDAPTDALGWPVCPDCRGSYQGVSFTLAQNNWTFLEYLRMTNGWTIRHLIIMFGWPVVVSAGINLLNHFVPESDRNTQYYRNTGSVTATAAVGTYGYVGQALRLYFIEYMEYLERPQTQIIDIELEQRVDSHEFS